ncbi:hypothetical protein FOCC_FOCC004641 [Frankliniella occidentalis]|nr:hypothetical protein FOCC_FOCC004641 [Frankliniella occidentalis]
MGKQINSALILFQVHCCKGIVTGKALDDGGLAAAVYYSHYCGDDSAVVHIQDLYVHHLLDEAILVLAVAMSCPWTTCTLWRSSSSTETGPVASTSTSTTTTLGLRHRHLFLPERRDMPGHVRKDAPSGAVGGGAVAAPPLRMRSQVRLQFVEPPLATTPAPGPERPRAAARHAAQCEDMSRLAPSAAPVRASIKPGGKFIVFADRVGPHNFTARGAPVLRSRATVHAIRTVLCPDCGEY